MNSEFAQLVDLLTKQGGEHSEIMSAVQNRVLEEYREKNPKSPADASVFVDQSTGRVRIFSGEKDITGKLANEAAMWARQAVIEKLRENKIGAAPKPTVSLRNTQIGSVIVNVWFWGYNLYYAAVSIMWTLSLVFGNGLLKFITGFNKEIAWQLAVGASQWIVPILAIIVTLRNKYQNKPGQLMKLFFIFELPLLLLTWLLAVIGPQVPLVFIAILVVLLLVPGVLYTYGEEGKSSQLATKAWLFMQELVLIVGGYLGLLLAFFVPLIIGGLAKTLIGNVIFPPYGLSRSYDYYQTTPAIDPSIFFGLGFGVLALILVSALVLLPYLVLWITGKGLVKNIQKLSENGSSEKTGRLVLIYGAVILALGILISYQNAGTGLLRDLTNFDSGADFDSQKAIAERLITKESELGKLVYEAQYAYLRYPFFKDDTTISNGYEEVFNVSPIISKLMQTSFINLAYPIVYQGERSDTSKLRSNYYYLFGYYPNSSGKTSSSIATPVSMSSVLLTYRKIDAVTSEKKTTAQITVEEEFDNYSSSQQEVIYEFNLPSEAVVSDLNLGPNLEFKGTIAPKGAAQRTYEQQLVTRRDPALLEQTGPRQYRLRVFPIPAKGDWTTLAGKKQKVQYTYNVALSASGYSLPEITKKTNVYANSSTKYVVTVNGETVILGQDPMEDGYVALDNGKNICSITNPTATIGDSSMKAIVSVNSNICQKYEDVLNTISGKRLAVLVGVGVDDKGFNNDLVRKQITSLGPLQTKNTVDIYEYNNKLSGKIKFADLENPIVRFGNNNVLAAGADLENTYDTVVVIMGEKDASIVSSVAYPFSSKASVYFVHPGGIPPYNLALTSKLIQNRGGVATSVEDAVRMFARNINSGEKWMTGDSLEIDFGDSVGIGILKPIATGDSPLERIVNKAWMEKNVSGYLTNVNGDVTIMDKLNDYAKDANIVTPYSSLLALVNQQQIDQLDQLSQDYNRYQDQQIRENITFTQPVPAPMAPRTMLFDNVGPSMMGFGGGMDSLSISEGVNIGTKNNSYTTTGPVSPLTGLTGSGGMFLLVNGILMVGGMTIYLVRVLRRKN